MALEICFQVTTISSTRAGVLQCSHPFSSKEKLNLPTYKGFKTPTIKLSSFSHSFTKTCQKSRIYCKSAEAVEKAEDVTDNTWNELVIANENPVLVEFWAPWCGPCRMIAPLIDEIAKEYAGKINCYKLNTDDSPSVATQYGIRSIPSVLFFKNGERKESIIGAVPKSTLTASVEKYLDA